MNGINDNDLRKFFASYWLLHSALYDFAQGLENQRNRRFTWAITNYYYSIVYIGRLFMFLTRDLYFTGHSDLTKFFMGEEVRQAKAIKLDSDERHLRECRICGNCNSRNSVNIEDFSECISWNKDKIKKFGMILNKLKEFRNKNTYEAFIIYAQENHSVLTEFMFSTTDRVREITEKYLKEACKSFFNFWKNKSDKFVNLINHEWLIPTTLSILEKHNLPTNDVKSLINRGFYFENEEIYQQNDLIGIRNIINKKPDKNLSNKFKEVCNIGEFRAKRKVIDDVFSNFKKLLEIEGE